MQSQGLAEAAQADTDSGREASHAKQQLRELKLTDRASWIRRQQLMLADAMQADERGNAAHLEEAMSAGGV